MQNVVSDMGRSFLRAFAGSLLILLPGVLTAPTIDGAKGLGVAALIASIAAGIRGVQSVIPRLSIAGWFGKNRTAQAYAAYADAFIRVFIGALLTSMADLLGSMPASWTNAKAAIVAALIGAATLGLRAVQGVLTEGDVPFRNVGIGATPGPPGLHA